MATLQGGGRRWWSCLRVPRARRVAFLVAVIALLSGVDLYLTVLYASTVGMPELNPLARGIMSSGSPAQLALWKVATVGLCIGLLLWTRRAVAAELGAWAGVLVLGGLMWMWSAYATETERIATVAGAIDYDWTPEHDPNWVRLNAVEPIDLRPRVWVTP